MCFEKSIQRDRIRIKKREFTLSYKISSTIMSFINSILKTFVGDKSKKDVKQLQPLVTKIKSFEQEFEGLSLDELRGKTVEFKARIAEDCKSVNDKIHLLEEEVKASVDIDKNEDTYSQIDKLKDERYKITENTLNEICLLYTSPSPRD